MDKEKIQTELDSAMFFNILVMVILGLCLVAAIFAMFGVREDVSAAPMLGTALLLSFFNHRALREAEDKLHTPAKGK
jgi:hypothetical protein